MERKLFQAFDRQKFQQNARLASIIGDVESRYAHAMTDEDLALVNAAGIAKPIKEEILPIPSGLPEERQR